ncbi:MAG TPA: class II aldolase/adducin family protein [Gammaproteobacteria bacterium]|nr:class II aldolase/adducin family protein [Gammaproteobacteria bacterium]
MSDNLRNDIIRIARQFNSTGLSFGRSGNISARTRQGFLITPSAVDYETLNANDLSELDHDGEVIAGDQIPSSEWQLHQAIFRQRGDVQAIVHVHSPWATGIACTRKAIPAFHYMITALGSDSIPCAEYATFGSKTLAENVLKALGSNMACLMSNHGQICVGPDLDSTFHYAGEVENLAKQYCISRMAGGPVLLDAEEMQVNIEKFKSYGKQ